MGYRSGNWTYEWTRVGMLHQKQAAERQGEEAADQKFTAALYYSIAG